MSAQQIKDKLKQLADSGMMAATASPSFYCDICKKHFSSANALIAHGQKVHGR